MAKTPQLNAPELPAESQLKVKGPFEVGIVMPNESPASTRARSGTPILTSIKPIDLRLNNQSIAFFQKYLTNAISPQC